MKPFSTVELPRDEYQALRRMIFRYTTKVNDGNYPPAPTEELKALNRVITKLGFWAPEYLVVTGSDPEGNELQEM